MALILSTLLNQFKIINNAEISILIVNNPDFSNKKGYQIQNTLCNY